MRSDLTSSSVTLPVDTLIRITEMSLIFQEFLRCSSLWLGDSELILTYTFPACYPLSSLRYQPLSLSLSLRPGCCYLHGQPVQSFQGWCHSAWRFVLLPQDSNHSASLVGTGLFWFCPKLQNREVWCSDYKRMAPLSANSWQQLQW
jgi:hypothetical protein